MVVNMYIKKILQRSHMEMRSMLLKLEERQCLFKATRKKKKSLKCVPVI